MHHNDGPNIKLADLLKLVGTGLNLVCYLVVWGSTSVLSFALVFQWYCFTSWGSPGVTIRLCRVLISDSS